MSAEEPANKADELMALARGLEHRGGLTNGASELFKRANSVLDAESLKVFSLFLTEGLIREHAWGAAESLARDFPDNVQTEAQRIIAAGRRASAGATEPSRRVAAKRALTEPDTAGGADLNDHLLDFCKLRQRRGDTVTGAEVLALQRRFRVATAARGATTPSYVDLISALTDIRGSGD